ncbi:MAG: hypothetical protein QOG72_1297 [Sphingomonadales bacterium]|jgi:hypothetical protein|nr:hypothetical protein [Sphingomonadales bacterium]
MRGLVDKMRRSRRAVPPLLALVLLFRLLIPAGYMIGSDGGGRPGLILCGAAAVIAHHPAHHGHDGRSEAPAKPDGHPCPFAALSAPPVPSAAPAVVPPLLSPASPPAVGQAETMARPALAAPPPPATGPPLPV